MESWQTAVLQQIASMRLAAERHDWIEAEACAEQLLARLQEYPPDLLTLARTTFEQAQSAVSDVMQAATAARAETSATLLKINLGRKAISAYS